VLGNDKTGKVRARDIGIIIGDMKTGPWNAITDVSGVKVGHKTIIKGDSIRTGVTAIVPHEGNLFQQKTPAGICVGNGFGKLTGYTQVEELGNIEAPIVLTSTLSVGTAVTAVTRYTLSQSGNEDVVSVNAVVGETNDYQLCDVRGMHISEADVLEAISSAGSGPVDEGSVGAGTGTVAFKFKGGIGTSSRLIPIVGAGEYKLGVIVQANYGGDLIVNGAPVGRELKRRRKGGGIADSGGGSCIIVMATDAPLSIRNLKRLAARAFPGLARTGSCMSHGSGEYAIAFSTAYRIPHKAKKPLDSPSFLPNDVMTPFFRGAVDATQEAVYNSMFMASSIEGYRGKVVHSISIDEVIDICRKYNALSF
jgi:D-aminopeptidase